MKTKLKERKPYYLIIARKLIFWSVVLMLGIAVFLYVFLSLFKIYIILKSHIY